MTSSVDLLHHNILKWLNRQGWTKLHDIQENAIRPILEAQDDVIISAATASGKTEAAILPACSKILSQPKDGIRLIYISPLKALINDQYKRLGAIGDVINIPVTPWHGDIGNHKKERLFTHASGILLITPESLESLLINHTTWCMSALKNVEYFVIDEFHAFIGDERGYQLLSQLHRLEAMLKHEIPRIALSATLSNINSVKSWLRPNGKRKITIIESSKSNSSLLLQIKGYNVYDREDYQEVATDIFKLLRSSTNLVFANSRSATEVIANLCKQLCENNHLPNEFFPHHGSLSKTLREELELRLKQEQLPTTAICTQTLELGIDLGDVSSVAQVDAPQSVASLRQRIGRSGRRDKSAIIRLFIREIKSQKQHVKLSSQLCDQTFLSVAMIELVLSRWFEPPTAKQLTLSTLAQQALSVIAQYGSVQAINLWKLLCKTGPFNLVSQALFVKLLRCLGENDLITQLNDGSITLGLNGEYLVSNYSFYTTFKTPDEYSIIAGSIRVGTIPLNQPLTCGDIFLFAGKAWEVIFFNDDKKEIHVHESKKNAEPLTLDGSVGLIHDGIREKMFQMYNSRTEPPRYLNKTAKENFLIGRELFQKLRLYENHYIVGLDGLYLFPWKGDKILYTITQILRSYKVSAKKEGSFIQVRDLTTIAFKDIVKDILKQQPPREEELSSTVANLQYEKYDKYLSPELLRIGYGNRNFDVAGALEFFKIVLDSKTPFDPATAAAYEM